MARSRSRQSSRRGRRSGYTLDLALRGPGMRLVGYRVGAVLLLLLALVGTAYAAWRGAVYVRELAFARNPRFTIREIRIAEGRIKTADMIREYFAYKGVTEGANLFGFDLTTFRDEYLAYNPVVRQLTIRRRLPDTLEVAVVERQPLARLGQRDTLVCDREGFMFRLSAGLHELPVIIGNTDPLLAPGRTVEGLTRAAVDVLAACEDPRLGLLVLGIDIRKRDYLVVHIVAPSGIQEVMLAWEGMGEPTTPDSRAAMEHQLRRVRQTSLVEERSQIDATFPDRHFGR